MFVGFRIVLNLFIFMGAQIGAVSDCYSVSEMLAFHVNIGIDYFVFRLQYTIIFAVLELIYGLKLFTEHNIVYEQGERYNIESCRT